MNRRVIETRRKEVRLIFPEQANELMSNFRRGKEGVAAPDLMNLIKKGATIKEETLRSLSTSIEEIQKWFRSFRIKQIEFWINGKIETGNLISLMISTAVEGGLKFIVEPKSHSTEENR